MSLHYKLGSLLVASFEAFLEGVCLASLDPETSKACLELFGRVDQEALEYTLEGLADALVIWSQK